MGIDGRLFRSKLAHRVFIAFVLCALIPIGVVAVVSYQSVTEELITQSSSRLRQASKALGLSFYERLLFAEIDLIAISDEAAFGLESGSQTDRGHRLRHVEIMDIDDPRETEPEARAFEVRKREMHLAKGAAVLMPFVEESDLSSVRLARRMEPENPDSMMIVGELDPDFLWGLEGGNSIPARAEFCVFEDSGRAIFGSFGGCAEAWEAFRRGRFVTNERETNTVFTVSSMSEERFLAGHRELFLDGRFFVRGWIIIVCEPLSVVVQPIQRWKVVFPAVVLLALWVVLLLVIAAIRKNLDPIDRLREGTARLAKRDFDFQVDIQTGDEFEELADAFNQMSNRLRRQFGSLAATGEVHRTILSSFEAGRIVEATIGGALEYFECDRAGVVMLDQGEASVSRNAASRGDVSLTDDDGLLISPDLRTELDRVAPGAVIGHDLPVLPELARLLDLFDMDTVFAVPIMNRGSIAAVIGLGFKESRVLPEEDLEQLTQLADQFAVALSNARMLEEVNDFSSGALEALARAVDAKSPWTAGHSERVTRLAVAIGSAMELDPSELSKLHRGAMLHDIGKLGISQFILDKKGRLDRDEFNMVRSHTTIGERILEPIGAFAEIMPVVSQHHERFDGSGYPNGLVGSQIDIRARILAVADVYDAMTNPRPYRESVEPHLVVEMIREQMGSEFDPEVVNAFLKVIDSRGGIEHLMMLKKDFSFFSEYDTKRNWNYDSRKIGKKA